MSVRISCEPFIHFLLLHLLFYFHNRGGKQSKPFKLLIEGVCYVNAFVERVNICDYTLSNILFSINFTNMHTSSIDCVLDTVVVLLQKRGEK